MYVFGMSLFSYQLALVNQHNFTLFTTGKEILIKILEKPNEDEKNCYWCIKNNSEYDIIQKVLNKFADGLKQDSHISKMKFVSDLLGLFNVILMFIIYGGPRLINFLTFINCLCMLLIAFINEPQFVLYLECSVVIVTSVIVCQCLYVLFLVAFDLHSKQREKLE